MDIRQWLGETADRAPPDQEEDQGLPDFLQPREEPQELPRRYRRKRKRASSDSSIIAPRHSDHHRAKATVHSQSANEVGGARLAATRSQRSQSSHRSNPIPDAVPVKTYERRPRHKTKLDRYELKPKKQRKELGTRKEGKSGSKRRRSHRSGDGGRTAGLVQSFQLKNGPKNSRLTLKPEATAGLFQHGRASEQVAGRGTGLPDLVFNEMRFLQRPKDHQDEPPKEDVAQPPSKKDRNRQREEEISAYFTANRPVTAEKPARVPQKQTSLNVGDRENLPRQRDADYHVDLPGPQFLGFGSRGVPLRSNSYYTWSESAQHHLDPEQEHLANDQTERPVAHRSQVSHLGVPPDLALPAVINAHRTGRTRIDRLNRNARQGKRKPSEEVKRPAHVEAHPPAIASDPPHLERHTSVTKTTEQSLPKRASSNGRPILPRDAGVGRQHLQDGYHTSEILNIRHMSPAETAAVEDRDHRVESRQGHDAALADKENVSPSSSTPTSKLLRKARDAVTKIRPAAVPALRPSTEDQEPDATADAPSRSRHGSQHNAVGQRDRPLPPNYAKQEQKLPERRLQTASSLGASHLAVRHASTPRRRTLLTPRGSMLQPPGHKVAFELDGEMLDDRPGPGIRPECIYASPRQAEGPTLGAIEARRTHGIYEMQARQSGQNYSDILQPEAAGPYMSGGFLRYDDTPIRSLSIEQNLRSERSQQGLSPMEDADIALDGRRLAEGGANMTGDGSHTDDLVGFWRPNKLY